MKKLSKIFSQIFSTMTSRFLGVLLLIIGSAYLVINMNTILFWFLVCFALISMLAYIFREYLENIAELLEIFD